MAYFGDLFSKGLCATYGADIPVQYATDIRNFRVKNGVSVPRLGYKRVVAGPAGGTPVRAMESNNGNLYAAQGGSFKRANLSTGAYVTVGSLPKDGPTSMAAYGQYTLVFSDAQPYVFNGEGLSAVSTYPTFATQDYVFGDASGRLKRAHVFTAAASANVTTLSAYVKKTGSPADNLSANLYSVVNGIPTALLASATPIAGGTFTTSYVLTNWTIPSTAVVAGTAYAIVLERSGAADASNYYAAQGIPNGALNSQECVHTGGTWLTDGQNSLVTQVNGVQTFSLGSDPRFGVPFANFMWAAGGNTGAYSKRNVLYVSRPATAANPGYCFDWTGSGSDALLCPRDILSLVTTLSRIFIFQDGRIDWIDKSSYVTIGGAAAFFRNPLAIGDRVASKDCAVAAGDKLFYMTDRRRIRTVNYALGVDQPEVGDLSEDPEVGIQLWLDNNLHSDQSSAFGWYDQGNKQVKFHVRGKDSSVNNLVVIWDMVAKTFLVDDNKLFGAGANHLGLQYAGSSITGDLYQDETGGDDDGQKISGYRQSAPIFLGANSTNKIWGGAKTSGTIGTNSSCAQLLMVDGKSVDQSTISYASPVIASPEVDGVSVAGAPVAGALVSVSDKPFLKDRTHGYVNQIGRNLSVRHSFSGFSVRFSLDTFETREKATKFVELTDVAPKFTEPFYLADVSGTQILDSQGNEITVT